MAAIGAVIARGQEHHDVFAIVGLPDWRRALPAVHAALRRLPGAWTSTRTRCRPSPPARRGLPDRDHRPTSRPCARPSCAALGVAPDVIAMSDEMGRPQARAGVLHARPGADRDPAAAQRRLRRRSAGQRRPTVRRGRACARCGCAADRGASSAPDPPAADGARRGFARRARRARRGALAGPSSRGVPDEPLRLTVVGSAAAWSLRPEQPSSCYLVELGQDGARAGPGAGLAGLPGARSGRPSPSPPW